jgi:DNA-binding SARP family transcriptional activator
MPAESASVAILGARPALPFTLETPQTATSADDHDILVSILDRLDVLQEASRQSQAELVLLRELNNEVLQAVTEGRREPEPSAAPGEAAPVASPRLSLTLLGPFEARVGDQPITAWPGKKARLLLAYLALEKGRMVPKDVLIEQFWPEARADRGANNLSIAIYQIRSSLAAVSPEASQAVTVRQGLYGISPGKVDVDLWQVQEHLDGARAALERNDKASVHANLRRAVSLSRGELLSSDPYEEWIEQPRRILNAAWQQALAWLASEARADRDWPAVIDFAGQILHRDGCDEAAHRMLIEAHITMGNRSLALQQYRSCVETLRRELGVRPSLETRNLAAILED